MSNADTKRFDTLIQKVATLDSLVELTPADRRDYDRLAAQWNDEQTRPEENYGF